MNPVFLPARLPPWERGRGVPKRWCTTTTAWLSHAASDQLPTTVMLRMCRTNKKLAGYRGKPAWEELDIVVKSQATLHRTSYNKTETG